MSERPVFIANLEGDELVETLKVEFDWFSGFSLSQKQKSIASLHKEASKLKQLTNILEISTKSPEQVGVSASAFNLRLTLKDGSYASVESFYQGSKVFQHGGPFVDLYEKRSLDAKRDERLRKSGDLVGFIFQSVEWKVDEHFYDWLYLNALIQNTEIADRIGEYEGFTDIEFNPKKSYNCQAYTAALFKAAKSRHVDFNLIRSPSKFKELIVKEQLISFPFQVDLF